METIKKFFQKKDEDGLLVWNFPKVMIFTIIAAMIVVGAVSGLFNALFGG